MKGLRKNQLAVVTTNCNGWRGLNETEYNEWRATYGQGMNCAGETKLAPRRHNVSLERGEPVIVLKARTAWTGDFGGPERNCAMVMTKTGDIIWMKRGILEGLGPDTNGTMAAWQRRAVR